jgi:rubrerythrin
MAVATSYDVFLMAEQIELLCAEGYRRLADRFAADVDERELFQKLHEEELQHANRVRLLAARYRHDSRLVEVPAGRGELEGMLTEARAVIGEIREGRFADTAQEALAKMAGMEERFAHSHAELISAEGHPAIREFFTQLAEQDHGHIELLRRK